MSKDVYVGVKSTTSQEVMVCFMLYGDLDQIVRRKKCGEDFHSVVIIFVDICITSEEDQAILVLIVEILNTVTELGYLVNKIYISS